VNYTREIASLLLLSLGTLYPQLMAAEPLRVVPQYGWVQSQEPDNQAKPPGGFGTTLGSRPDSGGIVSPDGELFVASSQIYDHSFKLVSKRGDLVWKLPLFHPSDVSFSPDGKWLAACGADDGFLLDLKACELRRFPAFRGQLISFTRDSQKILIVLRVLPDFPKAATNAEDDGLRICDLNARQIARYPVKMSVPHRLETLPDGKSIRIHGVHGDPRMHVPVMGKAAETIHLETGKTEQDRGPTERGYIGRGDDPRRVRLPAADKKKTFGSQPNGLCWNASSGLCVQYGYESAAWDIRHGKFLRTLDTRINGYTISGFMGADSVLGASMNEKSPISLVNLHTGKVSPTGVVEVRTSPGPDGNSLVVMTDLSAGEKQRLELYRLNDRQPIFTDVADGHSLLSFGWSRDGKSLAYVHGRRTLRIVSTTDGRFEEISLADVTTSWDSKSGEPLSVWKLEFDELGQWLAIGLGEMKSGRVAIVNCRKRRIEIQLEGFPIWVNALRFVGPDRLLTGTHSGRVQLWNLRQQQVLWTTETGQSLIQFGSMNTDTYVTCGHLFHSGTVLRLEDGKTVYRTSPLTAGGNSVPVPWTHPQLIGHGAWALEMDPESMQIRLIDVLTGLTSLTYCALPGSQWIVYTPMGDWDGSARVHDWVNFYNGLNPVSADEAEHRHRREPIDAILKHVFPADDSSGN
jgi:WD40 repeat protein